MKMKKSTYKNRDGELNIQGTFNFKGTLGELREIINGTINDYSEDTKCKITVFRRSTKCSTIIAIED